MSAPAPSKAFGRFTLLELLGRGGMAEVWKARLDGAGGFSRVVVVKRILPHLAADPHFNQMFTREARLSSKLSHANIIQVFEFGDHAGEPFLAMEYVAGCDLTRTLSAAISRGLQPPVGLAVFVVREVARALDYAHQLKNEQGEPLGLIHRDISPSNILLGFDGSVKLLDFGIAKALTEVGDKTQTGVFKGKVGYAAPEAAEGKEIDARADLFALGVVLHEALVTERLFRGASDIQTLGLVRMARADPPSKKNPQVSAELDRVCLKALARDPAERYLTARALSDDLDPLIHAHQFGPSQLAELMRLLFPQGAGTPSLPVVRAVPPALEAPTVASVPLRPFADAPPPRRGRRALISVAIAGLIAGAGAWLWWPAQSMAPITLSSPDPIPVVVDSAPNVPAVVPPQPQPQPQPSAPVELKRGAKRVKAALPKKRKTANLKDGEVVDPFSQ